MAECSEISLMLGAFEDAELEPNEMQEVAYHLARCDSCSSILSDYSTVGRELRSITPALDFAAPNLAGFADAVSRVSIGCHSRGTSASSATSGAAPISLARASPGAAQLQPSRC